jgi:hypothetical protein
MLDADVLHLLATGFIQAFWNHGLFEQWLGIHPHWNLNAVVQRPALNGEAEGLIIAFVKDQMRPPCLWQVRYWHQVQEGGRNL